MSTTMGPLATAHYRNELERAFRKLDELTKRLEKAAIHAGVCEKRLDEYWKRIKDYERRMYDYERRLKALEAASGEKDS